MVFCNIENGGFCHYIMLAKCGVLVRIRDIYMGEP